MGGALSRCLRLTTALLLLAAVLITPPTRARAGSSFLEGPYDHLSTVSPGVTQVQHEIGFILPADAPQIKPTDWVIVDAPGFSGLTPFTDMVGGFGSPVFDTAGTSFRATGFVMYPGTSVAFIGATATNPPVNGDYSMTIKIAKDSPNGSVSNSASFLAGSSSSYIVLSVTVSSPLSAVTISGYTSPAAFVSLIENGTVAGTTSASGDGSFAIYLTALQPGDHAFTVTSTDHFNLSTTQTVVQVHLLGGTSTTVSGILLSSTIQADKTSIKPGDSLVLSGTAAPNDQINIFTESPLRSYTAVSGSDGGWSFTLPAAETANYSPGQYRAYTVVQDGAGNQSLNSPTANFTVLSPDNGSNPPAACNISHGDLNCDGKTNLTDFSILLFYWGTSQHRADINGDNKVNLTDFSIMMFYFTF